MHESVHFDPYREKLEQVLGKRLYGSTLLGEGPKDELRALLEQAPNARALGSALLRCQEEADTAFSLEAAREFRLPSTLWKTYLSTLLERDARGVFAAFGAGLLAFPEAQELVLRLGTSTCPEMVGQYLAYGQLSKEREQKLVEWWTREHPLVFSLTSAEYLEERHGKAKLVAWVDHAANALRKLQKESNSQLVARGAMKCTRALSEYHQLRGLLGAIRARGYDAALEECAATKDELVKQLDLVWNHFDDDALEKVRRWIGALAHRWGVMRDFTLAERYMVGVTALLRWSVGDERPEFFLTQLPLKEELSDIDTRLLVEEVLTVKKGMGEEYDSQVLGFIRGIPHVFLERAKDAEDQEWTLGVIDQLFRQRQVGMKAGNDYIEQARMSEILRISLARGVELPERIWRYSLKTAPSYLLHPYDEDKKMVYPIHRLSRARQEQAVYAWMKSIEQAVNEGDWLKARSIVHLRRIIVSSKLQSSEKSFLRTYAIRLVRALLNTDISEREAWSLFCSLDKWFLDGQVTGQDFLEPDGLRMLSVFIGEPDSEVRRFISVVHQPKYLTGIPSHTVLKRWKEILREPRSERLLAFGTLVVRYLRTGVGLDECIDTAERWQGFVLYRAREEAAKVPRHLPKQRKDSFEQSKRSWMQWRARIPVLVSCVRSTDPEAALAYTEGHNLSVYSEQVLLTIDDIDEALTFIERHKVRLDTVKNRLNHALIESVFRQVLQAENRLTALQNIEALLDEFESPGTEASRLAGFMMHLFEDGSSDGDKTLSRTKFFFGGELVLGSTLSLSELRERLTQRLDRVLNPPLHDYLLAFRRNRRIYDEAMQAETVLPEGTLIHWTEVSHIGSILEQGNVCGESLAEEAKSDAFPLHVDALSIMADDANKALSSIMQDERYQYGDRPIALVYPHRRREDAFAAGEEYAPDSGIFSHRLIFGGIPKTEVGMLVIHKRAYTEDLLTAIKQFVVNGGTYIPIFLSTGELFFPPEEFAERYLRDRPYGSVEQFLEDHSWMQGVDVAQNGTHEHTLKQHLLLAEEYARAYVETFGLDPAAGRMVVLAARLHDVGKLDEGPQALSNVAAADKLLKRIRHLTRGEARSIRRLIHHDELLGDVLQGMTSVSGGYELSTGSQKQLERFRRIFPSQEDKMMLLALYLADVRAIGNGRFEEWEVESKLRWLKLLP